MVAIFWLLKNKAPQRIDSWFRKLQLLSAAAYSLGHGGNDAQKTMGIIASALFSAKYIGAKDLAGNWGKFHWPIILAANAAIAGGTYFGGWRIVHTMGSRITKLKPVGGFCAEFAGAITLFSTALAGIPVSTTHTITALLLTTRARFDESIAEEMRARELDPLSPQIVADLAYEYMAMRRYDESIAYSRKALELDPNLPISRANLAWAFALKGMHAQAIAEYDKIPEQAKTVAAENQLVASGLGWVYAVSGRRADALRIAKQFKDLSSHVYVDLYQCAAIYSGLGDQDEAFRLLEKGYEQHSSSMPFLAVDFLWDGMRSDPRYADLLRRIGLPQ